MLKTIRNRLILSHILPLLIIIPLLGIFLLYALETRVFLPSLTRELEDDAHLLSQIAGNSPDIWTDHERAWAFLVDLQPHTDFYVTLITPDRMILATTLPNLPAGLGPAEAPQLAEALQGEIVREIRYSRALQDQVIEVLDPVYTSDGQLVGVIQLLHHYTTLFDEFLQVRTLISEILVVALLLGAFLGYGLALSISRPISKITQAVSQIAEGQYGEPLKEQGPEEVRLLFETVNQLAERLHELEQSRKKLLGNLVHELGRPLGALRSAIQALRQGANHDQVLYGELLAGMDDEAARLQSLLDELAHLYKQILGSLELERREVQLAAWLPRFLIPWQQAAIEKHLVWQLDIPDDLPPVWVDPDRFAQAVGNLASNAIKYTPSGGFVAIRAGRESGEVWIQVSDTGPGIPQQEQEKIFMPFYRSEHGRRFPQGLGLGLSIARDVVLAHGGQLELESTSEKGSQFTIRLPVSYPEVLRT